MKRFRYIFIIVSLFFSCQKETISNDQIALSNAVLSLIQDGSEEKVFRVTVQVQGSPSKVSMNILNTVYENLTLIPKNTSEYEFSVLYIRKIEFPSGASLQCEIFADDVSILTNIIILQWQELQNTAPSRANAS